VSNFCEDCKHVSRAVSKDKPYYWCCMLHPKNEINFVSKDFRLYPPYNYCRNYNINGECPDFKGDSNEV